MHIPMVHINISALSTLWFFKKEELRTHKKFLVSSPLKIEKVLRACDFYFLSFLQGQIEIFETIMISQFPHIM